MLEEYKKIIKKKMSEKRYIHSVNVSNMAVKLAKKYGADELKAELAGLLHDITKEMPDEYHLKLIKNSGIKLNAIEKRSKKLWHSISGALFIQKELHISDEEIINAVRYHTTGRENMTLLEKIIFIADSISEDRKYENIKFIRKVAFEDINESMICCLRLSIENLVFKSKLIAEETFNTYNAMLIKYGSKFQLRSVLSDEVR